MQRIRIERRLPFGFMGDWGKIYKKYTFNEQLKIGDDNIAHENENYADIGQDVQFKRAEDAAKEIKEAIKGAMADANFIIAKTTDAYWDNGKREYECVAQLNDIVVAFGEKWLVKKIVTKTKYVPATLKFFYLGLESLTKGDING